MIAPPALDELRHRQATIDRLLTAEGAGHIVHDLPVRSDGRAVGLASRPWRLDPIPYVVEADEFAWLEVAIAERMRMLEAVLVDLYGERRLVADGAIDPALLWGSDRYRLAAVESTHRRHRHRWMSVYAVDVVRTENGRWCAVADHTDAPSGIGYAVLDRSVLSQVVHDARRPPRSLEPSLDVLRRGLIDASGVDGPRIAVFTGGIDHRAYVEHSYLATLLGFNLVEGADLVVRDRRLWLQTLGGLEPIDALYRRLSDRQLDPMETNATGSSGVPGVLLAVDNGSLAIANAHGTGVIEDPILSAEWDRSAHALLGAQPMLEMAVRTPGGIDAILGTRAERVDALFDDRVQQLPIVLRFHAVASDDGITVVPAVNGRVIAPLDDPLFPTPCLAKDVWVLGDAVAPDGPAPRAAPQVDLITSVPTRAADSLYWLCRAAERAEAVGRACRVVAGSPAPIVAMGPPSVAMRLLAALTGPADPAPYRDGQTERADIVSAASASIEFHVGSMLAESAGVREFLSSTTGRVLGELVDVRDRLAVDPLDVDGLDALLLRLSAFAGLWSESVIRGPAWYFGDYARRYERAVVALTGAATAVRCARDPARTEVDRRRGLEAVLAANDSLVAYRRRHRSDVELDAVMRLLVLDARNPRSAAASLAGLDRNAQAIGWGKGVDTIGLIRGSLAAVEEAGVWEASPFDDVIQRLHDTATELASTRLVAPPHPMLLRSGVVDPGAVA